MSQFYLNDKAAVERCYESMHSRSSITITGFTAKHQIKPFTGRVQSVQEDRSARAPYPWCVTILDE